MKLKLPSLKVIFLTPVVLFVLFYLTLVIIVLLDDRAVVPLESAIEPKIIAIFGASGTAGDGILKAALASPDIETIYLVTRRVTPRMEEGIASGKVQLTLHKDYLDYSTVIQPFKNVEAVYWAIGISSVGVDETTYGMIHVDFPMAFVKAWADVSDRPDVSFHYISSSDISEDSTAMWAREKIRAENSLFQFAENSPMRVIAYRPDYIGPTNEEANFGQDLVYWFFAPVKAAVRATQIGQAMIEVTARSSEFDNGTKIGTGRIIRYSEAYEQRRTHRDGVTQTKLKK